MCTAQSSYAYIQKQALIKPKPLPNTQSWEDLVGHKNSLYLFSS